MAEPFAISPYGLDFIRRQEGFRPRAYGDFKQNSIGYGTKARYPGEVIDRAEAERRLQEETGKVSGWLAQNVTRALNDNQEDALISAGYNLGTGPKGLGRLLGDINAGNFDNVAARLPSFNKAGGAVNPALVRRRAEEVALLTGKDPNSMATYYDAETPYLSPFSSLGQMPRPATIGAPAAGGAVPGGPMPINLPSPPSGRYSKLADALLASAAGAKPTGWGSALNALGDAALGYGLASKADNEQKGYQSALAQALGGASGNDAIAQTMIASGDPDLVKQGVALKVAGNKPQVGRFRPSKQGIVDTVTGQVVPGTEQMGDAAEYGTTPQYYTDKDGNLKIGQLSKAGGMKAVDLPEGAKILPGVDYKDTGTEIIGRDKRTGQIISAQPKDVAGKETQEALGKDRGAAQITLPVVEQTTDRLLDRLDRLDKSPIRGRFTGYQGYGMNITPEANDYQAILDEVQGNTFLTAFNNLRGGGAITEAEGAKATASLTRLQQTAPSDKGYQSALDDARAVFKEIRDNVRRRAGQTVDTSAPPAANNLDTLKQKYGLE